MLGPSGSGKTTCLMMLAGLRDRDPRRDPPRRPADQQRAAAQARHRHGVPELRAVPAHDRRREPRLPAAGAQAAARPRSTRRSPRALDMVQLGRFAGRRPAQLSGGQQQRVALARALVFEPELVLMDEPLGALDKQLREHMQYEIKHMHEQLGVTVVYVTHDQTEALTMSDRIAVFNDGRVQQLAPPEELYERPATPSSPSSSARTTACSAPSRHRRRFAAPCGSSDGAGVGAPPVSCGDAGRAHPALDPARAGRVRRRRLPARTAIEAGCSSSSTSATTSACRLQVPATTTSSSRCRTPPAQRACSAGDDAGSAGRRGLPRARRG